MSGDELADLRGRAGAGPVVTRGRSAAPELAQTVPKVGAPSFWGLGHRGAGRVIVVIDTGVGSDLRRHARRAGLLRRHARRGDARGPLRPGPRRHRGLRRHAASTSASAAAADVLDAAAGPAVRRSRPRRRTAPTAARWPRWPPATNRRRAWRPTPACTRSRCSTPAGRAPTSSTSCSPSTTSPTWPTPAWTSRPPTCRCPAAPPTRRTATPGPAPTSDAVAFRAAIQRLEARGIATTVATGNDAQTGSLGLPACVSNAIAVGASDLDDQIADFGNRGPTMELVAPGAREGNGTRRPHGHPREPGARVGRHLVRRPARGRRLRAAAGRSTRRPPCTTSSATCAAPARPPPIPTPAPSTAGSGCSHPPRRLPAGVLFPADAGVAGTRRGAVGDFDGDGFGDVLAHAPGSARRPHRLRASELDPVAPLVRGERELRPDRGELPRVGAPTTSSGTRAGSVRRLALDGQLVAHVRHRGASPSTARYFPLVGDYDGDGYDDIVWYGPGSARRHPLVRRAVRLHDPADVRRRRVPGGGRRRGRRRARRPRVPRPGVGGRRALARHRDARHLAQVLAHDRRHQRAARRRLRRRRRRRPAPLPGRPRRRLDLARRSRCRRRRSHRRVLAARRRRSTARYQPSVADIDGDGRDDILWYAPGSAADSLWFGRASGAPIKRAPLGVGHLHAAPRRPRRRRRRRHRLVPERRRPAPRSGSATPDDGSGLRGFGREVVRRDLLR